MNRYTPRQSAEFDARQQCFDFGMACRFVADLTASVKKHLANYVRKFFTKPEKHTSPPKQLFLDLIFSDYPLCQTILDPIL